MTREHDDPFEGYISDWDRQQFSRKGLIESDGRRWGKEDAERMRAGKERPVLIRRVTDEYLKILGLDTLAGGKAPEDIPYDKEGNIWLVTWPNATTEVVKENDTLRRSLVNPQNYEYEILNPSEVKTRDVNKLPLERKVKEWRYNKVPGLEPGIRFPGHIIKKAMEGEVRQARLVIQATNNLANQFLSGNVNRSKLEVLAATTGNYLEETGLFKPRDEDKKNMLEMLLKAPQLDSLGRVNPLVSRIRARSAYLSASKRLIVQGFVVAKFEKIQGILVYERETTRWVLEDAIKQLRIYVLGTTTLKRPGHADTEIQRNGIYGMLNSISAELASSVRVKPYLASARSCASNLLHSGDLVLRRRYGDARWEIENSIFSLRQVLDDNADIKTAGKA